MKYCPSISTKLLHVLYIYYLVTIIAVICVSSNAKIIMVFQSYIKLISIFFSFLTMRLYFTYWNISYSLINCENILRTVNLSCHLIFYWTLYKKKHYHVITIDIRTFAPMSIWSVIKMSSCIEFWLIKFYV